MNDLRDQLDPMMKTVGAFVVSFVGLLVFLGVPIPENWNETNIMALLLAVQPFLVFFLRNINYPSHTR